MDHIFLNGVRSILRSRMLRQTRKHALANEITLSPNILAVGCKGTGYFAGEYPAGITKVEGVPGSADILVLWKDPRKGNRDRTVVARTTSSGVDGTWRIDGLSSAHKYDVIAEKDGFRSLIMSDVVPLEAP